MNYKDFNQFPSLSIASFSSTCNTSLNMYLKPNQTIPGKTNTYFLFLLSFYPPWIYVHLNISQENVCIKHKTKKMLHLNLWKKINIYNSFLILFIFPLLLSKTFAQSFVLFVDNETNTRKHKTLKTFPIMFYQSFFL